MILGLSESVHGSILLPFLRYASTTTGSSAVSDLKIAHSVHHVDHKLIYDCARYEALQIACTPGRAHSKEDSRHSFTALPVLEFLRLLITTSISV
jgi:hypothetical protein